MTIKTKLSHQKRCIQLILDEKSSKEKKVLAELTLHEGTGCWRLNDIRLTRHRPISEHLSCAEPYYSSYSPKDQEESEYVKSKLREYTELDSGEILWASFDGPVRGHAEINGCAPKRWDQVGYFDKKEGLEKLNEIKLFWDARGDIGTDWRIDNPWRQPSNSNIVTICHFRKEFLNNNNEITPDFFRKMEDITFSGLPYLSAQKKNIAEDHVISIDQTEEVDRPTM